MKGITSFEEAQWEEYLKKQVLERDKKAWEKVMATKEGRWLFTRLLQKTGWESRSFTGNSQTFFNEGRRSIGIEIAKELSDLHGREGFLWRQRAEKEYIDFQEAQSRLFSRKED